MTTKAPKKLIEVALPLDLVNAAGAAEKLVKVGKPTNIHLWWARRPLAVARAVIFAQMVNDPGFERNLGRGVNKERAAVERERLFKIIEDLVKWENTNNEEVLNRAREEIRKSWQETCQLNRNHPRAAELFDPEVLPAFHDPFAGGGVLPLEAQRLGLVSVASDLNPVAVLINKALIEVPPAFANLPPIGEQPETDRQVSLHQDWSGSRGLAEDIRRYGTQLRSRAAARIGLLYPKIEVTPKLVRSKPELKALIGSQLTVVAWLWARTVRSPSPAFAECETPLLSTYVLSSKSGLSTWLRPSVEGRHVSFAIEHGTCPDTAARGTKSGGGGGNFLCLFSQAPITTDYIRAESNAGRVGAMLVGIVADGPKGRVYLPATAQQVPEVPDNLITWSPDVEFFEQALGFRIGGYGFKRWSDLFTRRQLAALSTLTDLVQEVRGCVFSDARRSGQFTDDDKSLEAGGAGARAYADAISLYLALAVSRTADWNNSFSRWESKAQVPQQLFGRQAIPMVWDYSEANPISDSTGSLSASIENIARSFTRSSAGHVARGIVYQADAMTQSVSDKKVISTDPPYYDNIGYADLSDFFYMWLRRCLRSVFPDLTATVAVPKAEELVATPARHGGKDSAEAFFLDGMTSAMRSLSWQSHPGFPVTIYYAFKQSENKEQGTASTGWETFLEAVLHAGLVITGTWPLSTENASRLRGQGSNALASSIVLVCRRRSEDAPTVSRREFIRELNAALPDALDEMTRGGVNSPVAPVDLSQAIIGPGMAIFSKYKAVLEADGSPMSVRTALTLINRFFAEEDFDHDTQFCLHWFENSGWTTGKFGEADVLARAKGTAVDGLVASGVVESSGGKLRLFRWAEYPADWAPEQDRRASVWEALHQLIRALKNEGESAAGTLLARMPEKAEPVRALAYRLYTLCERKGWAEDARAYNELITSWTGIEAASQEAGHTGTQRKLEL